RVILPRQARIVTHGFGFAEAGETDWARALKTTNACRVLWRGSKIDTGLICRTDLKEQRLLEHQRAVPGDGLRFPLFARGRGRPPAGRIDGHRTTSFSAASKAAISSSVTVSVTAITRPFCRASTLG